ncbi:esterase-like activity of phytase family protein [Mycolicibacterium sp.]|uniref:esterase-like activity of phytase family protein n=1 Tax=Mycolicibacterium sp. TaxID=2320850 RepID=UPI0037CC8487
MRRVKLTAVATLLLVSPMAACSTGAEGAAAGGQQGKTFGTAVGTPLVFTPGELLAATGGTTPVGYARPEHGTLSYGAGGTVVYTPDDGYTGADALRVTVSDAVRAFAVDTPPLATIGGVEVQSSGNGSAIAAVPGTTDQFYGLTDRGPNVDGRTDGEKVLPVPEFQPHITAFTLRDGVAVPGRAIRLSGRDGAPLVGLVDPQADTGETLVDINGKPLPTSDHGLDTEGLVALPDGTFWVSDEYGPFLVHFDAQGKELERLSPFDGTLPRELSLRSANQGMEGLTITPDGKTLVGIMQSALKTPGLSGSAKSVPLSRIVTVDLATKDVREYLYPLSDPQESKVAVSEITALGPTTFLVDERDGELQPGANKKIYLVDIATATDVGPKATVGTYRADAGGLQIDGKPIETLVGVTTDAAAVDRLKAAGVTVATKTLKLDLGALVTELNRAGEFFGHDKIEGLATPDGGKTLVIANDSDFGLAGIEGDSVPLKLKPKVLANGRQDSGEFLEVDTTKLPAKTREVTLPLRVG